MKTRTPRMPRFLAFTVLEVIGVLSVVAILAAVITPRIFAAIDDANLSADLVGIKNVRSATESYFQRYGRIGEVGGGPITTWNNNAYEGWDRKVLMSERFLDKAFVSRIGTNSCLRVLPANTNVAVDPLGWANNGSLGNQLGNNGAYDLLREYACQGGLNGLARGNGSGPILAAINLVPRWSIGGSPPSPPPGGVATRPPGGGSMSHASSPMPFHNDAASGSVTVEVVLQGVSVADAYRLSLAIDGPTQSNWAYWDSQGRVKYDFANAALGNVFIYIADR